MEAIKTNNIWCPKVIKSNPTRKSGWIKPVTLSIDSFFLVNGKIVNLIDRTIQFLY
jgi:hypothetical protein